MATENALKSIPYTAAADLSALQYTFVKMAGDYAVTTGVAAGGVDSVGILQNDPLAGQAAVVAASGQSKVVLGATLAAGARVTVATSGKVVAATTGDTVLGKLVEGGDADEIGAMILETEGVAA
jgi:hypothetical protein